MFLVKHIISIMSAKNCKSKLKFDKVIWKKV